MNHKVNRAEAVGQAQGGIADERERGRPFAALEKQDEIERLLADLKREKA